MPGPSLNEQAAHWVLRSRARHSNDDNDDVEAWLAQDDAHIEAYADGMLIWEQLGRVAPDWSSQHIVQRRKWRMSAFVGAMLVVVACMLGFGISRFWLPDYRTGIGEQKLVRLEDGSRVVLNTNSELKVRFEKGVRRIKLMRGEALFDVAHDTQRPFVVEASNKYVRAVGTSFVVRSDKGLVEVILLSGLIDVGHGRFGSSHPLTLKPGDRWRETGKVQVMDRPEIDTVTAWRKGQIILEGMPLDQAVAEMNRYTKKPILVRSRTAGRQTLSGVVRIDEPEVFVRTVASVYGLQAEVSGDAYVLSGDVAP